MILDVPTSDELTQAGTNLLNLAWATDQPYRQISSSMRIGSQPGLAGRGVCAAKLGDALAGPHDAITTPSRVIAYVIGAWVAASFAIEFAAPCLHRRRRG